MRAAVGFILHNRKAERREKAGDPMPENAAFEIPDAMYQVFWRAPLSLRPARKPHAIAEDLATTKERLHVHRPPGGQP